MAMEVSSPTIKQEPGPTSEIEWDESRIASSLARLQGMHIQLRQLRETIPSLVRAIHNQQASPEDLYKDLASRATSAVKNVQGFARLMRESRTRVLLQRAEESKVQDDKGIKDWLVTQHENWLERTVEDDVRELKIEEGPDEPVDIGAEGSVEYVDMVLGKFREGHPDVEISLGENNQDLKVFLPPPSRIRFHVGLKAQNSNKPVYPVTCEGKSQRDASILRAVATRSEADSLPFLLEMLASYSDITARPCQNCDQSLDSKAQFPVVRASRRIEMPDGSHTTLWDALHFGCAKR